MSTSRQTQIRLTPEDDRVLDHLHRATGIRSGSEIIRMALREAAIQRGWVPGNPPATATEATGTDG